jgi:YHS domain-containing protein
MPVAIRIAAAMLFALLLMPLSAFADDIRPVNTGDNGFAIKGMDVVAYFDEKRPVEGESRYSAAHKGVVYRFASAENRDRFTASPERFAPSYGGYCAFGVLMGEKVDVDPRQFRFEDGRLLMFFSAGTHSQWQRKRQTNLAVGDQVWTRIENVPQSRLPLKN